MCRGLEGFRFWNVHKLPVFNICQKLLLPCVVCAFHVLYYRFARLLCDRIIISIAYRHSFSYVIIDVKFLKYRGWLCGLYHRWGFKTDEILFNSVVLLNTSETLLHFTTILIYMFFSWVSILQDVIFLDNIASSRF